MSFTFRVLALDSLTHTLTSRRSWFRHFPQWTL